MSSAVDKPSLHAALIETLEAQRATMLAAQKTSSEGVTHADARSDGSKDMRATEASYVARGQAQRVDALDGDLARVRATRVRAFAEDAPIALSALVVLSDADDRRRTVYLAAAGGGVRIAMGGAEVQVITPQSPLGRALVGATIGDDVAVVRGAETLDHEILAVR